MSEEELIKTLRVFEKNRVEQLEEPARNLFYAIMKIAGERDRLNNIIKEAREKLESKKHCERFFGGVEGKTFTEQVLEILDKGSDKEWNG